MSRITIKICGLTRPADVTAAVEAGADALGLVFVPASPRALEPAQAAALVTDLPPFITLIGLFMDPQPAQVEAVLAAVPLDQLQVHGTESAAACARYGRPYIKTVPLGETTDPQRLYDAAAAHPRARALLIDGHGVGELGGQGRRVGRLADGRRWGEVLARPLVLAGGLAPGNVAAAVAAAAPAAVDVSSGIERAPGIKDPALMRRFVEEVRGVC